MLAVLIPFDRPLIRGDGVAYLAWLDTLLLDRDIDFGNQLEKLAPVNTYQITWNESTGRLVNIFPFGVALVQGPFFLLGDLFSRLGLWDLNPDYFRQMQGIGSAYSLWLMLGANVIAILTALIAWALASNFCGRITAALVAWSLFVGTPIFYYSTISPLNSHNAGALMVAVFLGLLAWSTGGRRSSREASPTHTFHWLLLGVAGGVLVLVRWQLLLVTLAGIGLVAWQRQWRGLIIASITFLIVLIPLPLVWNSMFGQPFVVPYEATEGGSFLLFLQAPQRSGLVLWELLRHSPILLFSFAGLYFLWRHSRRWAIFAGVVIGAQALVNGAVLDWWAGDAYGMRRMSELYPLYVVLAAAVLGHAPSGTGRITTYLAPLLRVTFFGLLAYAFVYIAAFILFTWTNPDHQFIAAPAEMLRYYFNHPQRSAVMAEVMRAHVGPPAWAMPGP